MKILPDALIPGLLLLATAGTATSPVLSSWVVELAGATVALALGASSGAHGAIGGDYQRICGKSGQIARQ